MAAAADKIKDTRIPVDEIELIRQQSQTWFRTQLQRFSIAIFSLVILLGISLAGNFLLFFNAASVRYFAVTPDYRVIKLDPLDQPTLTAAGLKDWTRETVVRALTLNFKDYRRQLTDVQPRFTSGAFNSFKNALQSAGLLNLIIDKRLVTSVTAEDAPVIVSEQLYNGALHWQLEFPIMVTLESSAGTEGTHRWLAKVLVGRVPPTESLEGVRVAQIVLAPPR